MFLVDRQLLEKLERLTLEWRKPMGGIVGGPRTSRFAGPGQEFLDHRNFYPGDDARQVNWRVYMRFERFFLKTFHLEPRVPVRLLFDTSASMTAKFAYAQRLAAALIYIGMIRLDAIAVQPFSSTLTQPHLATGGRQNFPRAEAFLRSLEPYGESNFPAAAREFVSRYEQPGFLIAISDFLNEDAIRALEQIAAYGHELLTIQVCTTEDRLPEASGSYELVDSETGERIQVQIDEVIAQQHAAAFDEHADRLDRATQRAGGRYAAVRSGSPLEDVLFGPLAS